jgi:MscS family membrane protein
MPLQKPWLTFLLLLLFGGLLAAPVAPAHAQIDTSSKKKSTDAQRSSSESPDFFEILRSGGELLIKPLRSSEQAPTVDDPKWNSLSSPRATVMTFQEAMRHIELGREQAWPRVEKTLAIAEGEDLDPHQVAWQLKSIFDRLTEISPSSIPGQDQVQREDIHRFPYFPDALDHQWIWSSLDKAPQGKIVLTQTDDGRWLFSEETTRGAAQLAESLQNISPRANHDQSGELFLQVFRPVFLETPWWGWLSLAGGIAGGILLAWLGCKLLNRIAEACNRRGWTTIGQAWLSLGKPATMLLVAVGVLLGSGPVRLGLTLEQFRWATIEILLLLALSWLIIEIIDLIVVSSRRLFVKQDDNYVDMGMTFIRRAIRITAAVVLTVFVVQNLFSVNITALLGGLGLAALAVSLAAQDAVKNLFGAIMVFATRPFLVGDWIRFRQRFGEVEDVSLQVTKIRLLSGDIWTVPNMHFTSEPVENCSMRKYLRRKMNVQITYDTPAEKIQEALAILHEILTSDEVVKPGRCRLEDNPPVISFNKFGSHYFNILVYYWYYMSDSGEQVQRDVEQGWFTYLDHCSIVNKLLVERFNDAGIDFAFPTQTLYLTDDPDRNLELALAGQDGGQASIEAEQHAGSDGNR